MYVFTTTCILSNFSLTKIYSISESGIQPDHTDFAALDDGNDNKKYLINF